MDPNARRFRKLARRGGRPVGAKRCASEAVGSAPVNLTLPVITGTTAVGDTLTCSSDTWSGVPAPTFARQWQRDGADIAGETAATHVIVTADLGTTLTCEVTATNAVGSAMAESAGTAIPYVPDYEAGLILDLWAEAGITEAGTGVSSWVSGVGAHDFVQATDSKRPTYEATGLGGKPSVLFAIATSESLVCASSGPTSTTNNHVLIVACNQITAGGRQDLMDIQSGRLWFASGNYSVNKVGWFDSAERNTGAAATGAQILSWVLGGGTGECFRGSTSLGTATYVDRAVGGAVSIGSDYVGSSCFGGRLGRAMLFNTIDAARDARVRAWMSTYYGIAL